MKIDRPIIGQKILIRNEVQTDLDFLTGMWFDEENERYTRPPYYWHLGLSCGLM